MVSSAGTEPAELAGSAKPAREPTLLILLPYPSLTPRRPRPPLNTPPAPRYAGWGRTCVRALGVAAGRWDTDWSLEFNRQPPPHSEHTTLTGPPGSVGVSTTPVEAKTLLRLESIEIQTRPRLHGSKKNGSKTEKKNITSIFFLNSSLKHQQRIFSSFSLTF